MFSKELPLFQVIFLCLQLQSWVYEEYKKALILFHVCPQVEKC